MEGPPEVMVVTVELCNGSFQFYTFTDEESQLNWVEQLSQNARQWNVERIMYGESILNYTDFDSDMFIVH